MKLTIPQKVRFTEYVRSASEVTESLSFVLSHFIKDPSVSKDASSLEVLETFYRNKRKELDGSVVTPEEFLHMLGQLLGEAIIEKTSAKWKQSTEKNHTFGQPCICDFGEKKWDLIFPAAIALVYDDLPQTQPNFVGLRDGRVFAFQFEKALKIYNESKK